MLKKYLINGLILLPFIWLSTGMLILRNGDKTMVVMIIISLITTLLIYGSTTLKHNISTNKTLWLLFVICSYFLFSYYYHGLSSREIRSFIAATLLVAIFPSSLLTKKIIIWLTVISALISFCFAYYCMFYMHWNRSIWPINAIPYSTLIASIGVISLSLCLASANNTEKAVTFLAFLLSSYALVITETRGVWLGFIVSLAIIFIIFITTKKIKITGRSAVITIILIAGISVMSKPLISQRLAQTHQEYSDIKSGDLNTSIGLRLQMWQSAPMFIEHHEILGQGNQYLALLDTLYRQGHISKSLYTFQPPHFHNQYVDYMVKKGVIGLILLLCLFILPLCLLKNTSILQRYITISLVSLFAVASLTDVPLNHGQTIFMYIFWLGCFTTTSNNEHADND
ncbi:O-antigen ligase family protein [Photobacterium piscicola]|uniref:O-antigen ligase family protein n=1 Tax=Photobacterium piscicola TaxID=1378299 RepID=UPI002E19C768|nr:O-antigen ligase family protein [Photobacterium piscicola]